MSAIIRFDKVTVTARDKILLSQVSFSLHPGEKAVLCGKSGAGKSSILRALLGMHSVVSGTIYFQNLPLSSKSVQTIRHCTAYIGQEPILGADKVRDALLLPFLFKSHRADRPTENQLIAVLQRLQLPAAILNQPCERISGGEKQRIALARGLLLGKTVYLLDEVTSALDQESKQAVFEVFADPQLTVLAVAHDPDWLANSGHIFEMHAGELSQVKPHGNT